MVLAIEMQRAGGPEVLAPAELELAPPAPGEVRIRQTAIGVNFVDIYHRTGLYPLPRMPAVLGVEAAGEVEEVGAGVADLRPGDRVAYGGLPAGSYAAARNLPAGHLIRLPAGVSARMAAAATLRGLTVHMLLHRVAPVGPGDRVLIHAAAGGLGLLLVQWARRLGATTIGTVGSEAKAQLAVAHGLDHPILYRRRDFAEEVRALTDGRGVDLAIDGIGGEVLVQTLACVRLFGVVASIGQAGGAIPPIDVADLGPRRSLTFARPSVLAYAADPETYAEAGRAVMQALEEGLRVTIGAEFPLAEAARAQAALEGGSTTGSVILVP